MHENDEDEEEQQQGMSTKWFGLLTVNVRDSVMSNVKMELVSSEPLTRWTEAVFKASILSSCLHGRSSDNICSTIH
jgi:hypothetical protein